MHSAAVSAYCGRFSVAVTREINEEKKTPGGFSWNQSHARFLTEQLQVRDRNFSFLVSSLSDQPVRVHPRHGVNCDQL